jgi:probable F420-dependent oxidoreductase
MTTQRPFRFGVSVHQARSKAEWVATAQKAEALGYSTMLMPDHLGEQLAPVPALLAASEATHALRIGSFVFDNDFRHPVMLAKEAATLDILSGGRFEFGLGAGWDRSEYEQSGIPYDPPAVRVSRMEEALHIIKGLFADGPFTFSGKYYTVTAFEGHPKPVQQPHPPILIGGGGKRLLSIAAREATIVGFTPIFRGAGGGTDYTDAAPAALMQKVEWVRQAAGDRFDELELNILVGEVFTTEEREQAAQFIAATMAPNIPDLTPEVILSVPYLLIGSVDQICADLLARREQFGISYISIFERSMEALAPVVARLAGK